MNSLSFIVTPTEKVLARSMWTIGSKSVHLIPPALALGYLDKLISLETD